MLNVVKFIVVVVFLVYGFGNILLFKYLFFIIFFKVFNCFLLVIINKLFFFVREFILFIVLFIKVFFLFKFISCLGIFCLLSG